MSVYRFRTRILLRKGYRPQGKHQNAMGEGVYPFPTSMGATPVLRRVIIA
jgi:hypothetical protein